MKRSTVPNFRVMYEGINHMSEGEYQGVKWLIQTQKNMCLIKCAVLDSSYRQQLLGIQGFPAA